MLLSATILRRLSAEFLGTMVLLAAIVGSGVMGQQLTDIPALTLLINCVGTVTALAVMIWTLGPISGGHFNPAVTTVALARREIPPAEGLGYMLAQVAGALMGVGLANAMFGLGWWVPAEQVRGGSHLLGELVATAGLIWVIGALTRSGLSRLGPVLVPAWIGAAMLFTSSTAFANPAVTVARAFTDSFSGIALASVAAFIGAQLVGAGMGAGLTEWFHPRGGRVEPMDLPAAVHHRNAPEARRSNPGAKNPNSPDNLAPSFDSPSGPPTRTDTRSAAETEVPTEGPGGPA